METPRVDAAVATQPTGSAQHCCVPGCTNDSRKGQLGISFHRFPAAIDLRKDWIVKIRRDPGPYFKITNSTRACSAHFLPTDIKKSLAGKRYLVSGAVPSVFSWTSHKQSRRKLNYLSPVSSFPSPESINITQSIEWDDEISKLATPPVSADHDYTLSPPSNEEKLDAARKEILTLKEEVAKLQGSLFCLSRFSNDSNLVNFYTGFKNYATLQAVFNALKPTAQTMVRWTQMQRHSSNTENIILEAFRHESLQLIDQFFMFLCRVRQGLPEQDLAVRFAISQASVSRILITWANYLYVMLGSLPIWPSRACIDQTMPACFTNTYPNTRVILDCTEIKVQTPSSKVLNSEIYSNYKSHTTFKSLIGITPFGSISFISSSYTGGISDKAITRLSGVLDFLDPNDQVMADKGFLIDDLLQSKQASLVMPPFLGEKGKFSKEEVTKTHEIARLRIHVERAIRRVKEYHIFDGIIPLNLASSINQIWTVCCILTNFRGPLF